MMEREPEERDDLLERLIPEIPGVEHSEEEAEDWGTLYDEPDEESQEDTLEEVASGIRKMLTVFGIEGINGISQEEITRLWERMDMDQYLIADLALYSMIDKPRVSRSEFA